jgi:hypothetical protein
MSPKRIFFLGTSLMFLTVSAAVALTPSRWTNYAEPATRMAAFLPMVPTSTAHNGSADYATVYDCAEWSQIK